MTDGKFDIEFYEPGALIPVSGIFEAVATGAVDAAYTGPVFHATKEPALELFSNSPFGPPLPELLAWVLYGGGKEKYEEIWAKYNVQPIFCGSVVPEASGWFRKEIKTPDDVVGLKMRALALGGKVWDKLGASTQLIPGHEIYQALERGVIDAADFAFPSMDVGFGLQEVAKHYYYPGWQQPAAMLEMIVHKPKWDALPASYKKVLEQSCRAAIVDNYASAEAKQVDALEKIKAAGVEIHEWTPEMLQAFRDAWDTVAKEEDAKNETFREVRAHRDAFRERYKTWSEIAYGK